LKILQVIQKPQLRGAEIFACQLSNHLLRLGHEVKMVCLLKGNATLPFSGEVIHLDRPLGKRFFDIAGWRQFAQIVRDFQPDIVQANAGDTLKFSTLSKLIFRWRSPIVFRNANKVSDFINSTPKRLLNGFFVGRLSHVISVSELCRQDFIRTYSWDQNKTTMIPIGIETAPVADQIPGDLKDIFATGKVLVNVASLVPEKNHEGLIRIIKALRSAHPELKTLIVGDGKLRSHLQERIVAEGMQDNIIVLGYRKDVLSIMRHATALVMPSLVEGLPGVILEAFYCKLPVIANNVGGVSEVVVQKKTGWLIEKGNEKQFAECVLEALNSNDAVERICQNAYTLVTAQFTNVQIAERFEKAYQMIIANG
jgi:glycosyltransferase involved in cell wall biosynthesis